MRDRKASLSATPNYITAGLSLHTVLTPDEPPPISNSSSSSNLGGYFSLSRTPSYSKNRERHPSISDAASVSTTSSGTTPFTLKLAHPRTPMFTRSNSSAPGVTAVHNVAPTSNPGSHISNGGSQVPTSPHAHFTAVHETCTKRIATLDYLRRSHEGRVYWFNCLLIPRGDLQRAVYPDVRKLQKKATHYFLLGNSLPGILELGTSNPLDYLKAFNILLQEYESYIALPPSRQPASRSHSGSISHHHPVVPHTSSASSALRNMSLPKLFSRQHTSKPRRGSTATGAADSHALERTRSSSHSSADTDLVPPLPLSLQPPLQPTPSLTSAGGGAGGEEFTYLQIPVLPFDVDYFEVFVTLCDTLIDVYLRVLALVGTPAMCNPVVGEAFAKADARVRRILVQGVVREWEEAVRVGIKREAQGVAKEVLGGIL